MTLNEFIEKNELSFEVGERNTNLTVLVGYALYRGLSLGDCKESILKTEWAHDRTEIFEEMERIWKFAEPNKYGDWWKTQAEWIV